MVGGCKMIYRYVFDKDKCWYKDVCNKIDNHKVCRYNCPRYLQMFYLFNNAGIPEKLQYPKPLYPSECDVEQFVILKEIKDDIENWVNNGENLYIFSSKCGNGKTTWAIKLISAYFNKIWAGNGYEPRGVFVRCSQLFTNNRDSWKAKDDEYVKWKNYLELIETCDLVVWDDIGEYELQIWEQQLLMKLIDNRLINGKANIFTSNVIDSLLTKNIGPRLSSRVLNSSEVIEFLGSDRRGK